MKVSKEDKTGFKACFAILTFCLIHGGFSWYEYMQTRDIAWFVLLSLDMPLAMIFTGGILFLFGKMVILGVMGKCEDEENS